jgi:hypothetical protein
MRERSERLVMKLRGTDRPGAGFRPRAGSWLPAPGRVLAPGPGRELAPGPGPGAGSGPGPGAGSRPGPGANSDSTVSDYLSNSETTILHLGFNTWFGGRGNVVDCPMLSDRLGADNLRKYAIFPDC